MLDKVNYKESLALFPCRVRPCCWTTGLCWMGLCTSWCQYL